MRYLTTGVTYRLQGLHKREDGEARGHKSVLDYVCVTRDLWATVSVLTNSTTDHFPAVATIKVNRVTTTQKTLKRRNFKALERPAIIHALEFWQWLDVYGGVQPGQAHRVRQLTGGAMGYSECGGGQASPASAHVGHEGG
jgi:hypothetical protein